ncbi:MAG: IclR family transcriptional regulator [Flavobacteriaceae bacterium]|nr:IclR family transcriptional regulator [Flavobacteriaceae bacterium]
MENKKNGIQSINIGFSIINVLLESPFALPLKEISRLCGLSPSKIHSYLVSFSSLGLVVQDPNSNHYSLGPYALQLGLGYLDQVNLFSIAKPNMEKIAKEIGQTVFLGVWGNKGPTIVYRVDSQDSTGVFELRIGSVLPVLDSALGINFVAHLPEIYTKKYIDKGLKQNNEFKNKKELDIELSSIRENGMSRRSGILLTDFTALSVPIFDFTKNMIAGLTVMGRIGEFDDDINGEIAKKIKSYGLEISENRGYKK